MPRYSLTQAELESMRMRLCEGALALFRDYGIDAVTFRGLADALGVSHTLPYRYFENKDALLAAVRVMCFAEFERFVRERESAATSDSPATSELARVLAVVDAYVDFVFQHPVEYTLIFVTAQPPPQRYPELLAARRSLFEHSVELVRRCVQMGVVRGDPREITHAVWASVHGLLTLHVANQLVHGCRLEELVRPTVFRILGVAHDNGVAHGDGMVQANAVTS
jgi:AcrR family transcriptional regulator